MLMGSLIRFLKNTCWDDFFFLFTFNKLFVTEAKARASVIICPLGKVLAIKLDLG